MTALRFHLVSPFRTLLDLRFDQAIVQPARTREVIASAIEQRRADGDAAIGSPWLRALQPRKRYRTLADDDVSLFATPLFTLDLTNLPPATAVAEDDSQPGAWRLSEARALIFDNTIGVLQATLTATLPLDAALARVDAESDLQMEALAAHAAERIEPVLAALSQADLATAQRDGSPRLLKRPSEFLTFRDVTGAGDDRPFGWPADRNPHLWTNRTLVVDLITPELAQAVERHWRVPASCGVDVPNAPGVHACINIGNSVLAGGEEAFAATGFATVMATVQFFYAQLDVIRAAMRHDYAMLDSTPSAAGLRSESDAFSRANAQVNFIISEWADYRLGVQGVRKWYADRLHACFEVETLIAAVRLKQHTVQERLEDLRARALVRLDRVLQLVAFVLGALSLLDVSFAVLAFAKGGFRPTDPASGEWRHGPLAWLGHVPSDAVLMALLAVIALVSAAFLQKSRR